MGTVGGIESWTLVMPVVMHALMLPAASVAVAKRVIDAFVAGEVASESAPLAAVPVAIAAPPQPVAS